MVSSLWWLQPVLPWLADVSYVWDARLRQASVLSTDVIIGVGIVALDALATMPTSSTGPGFSVTGTNQITQACADDLSHVHYAVTVVRTA